MNLREENIKYNYKICYQANEITFNLLIFQH